MVPTKQTLIALFQAFLLFSPLLGFQSQSDDSALRQEEEQDYFEKWLKQDVRYIISDEERDVFESLSTPEEKEQFIEQFWFRRDPDPRTANNEFKEEHYRRIAYANDHFTSGDPGWLTDRGRVYIIHGQPDNIESRPTGGFYKRPIEEGGGTTTTFPFEKWTYRHIDGIGEQVELEFVDKTDSGKYELAVFYWEKDSALNTAMGATMWEEMGASTRADRPAFTPAAGGSLYGIQNMFRRVSDTPFYRYETIAKVGAAPVTKYKDLKELVDVNVTYANLPFEIKEDYFKLNEVQALVPITVQVDNKVLSFKIERDQQVARIAVFAIVSTMTNRIVTEFEDDLVVRYKPDEMETALHKSSAYQKILPLDVKGRYKLDLVLKDLNSMKVGVIRKAIVPPTFNEEKLEGSSMLLSDQIQPLADVPEQDEMFVLGDVKILPKLDATFTNEMPLGVYFQVYNTGLDQSTLEPSLKVTYTLLRNGEVLAAATDAAGESTQFFSGRRVVLMKHLSLEGLDPGKYQIQIEVTDQLTNQSVKQVGDFTIAKDETAAS